MEINNTQLKVSKCDILLIYITILLIVIAKIFTISIENLGIEHNYFNDIIFLVLILLIYIGYKYCKYITYEKLVIFFLIPLATLLIVDINYRSFISLIILILMMPVYSLFIAKINRKYAFSILIISIFILAIQFYNNKYFGNFYWGYYGRERLLLGIFHPKEQCYILIYFFLLVEMYLSNKRLIFLLYLCILYLLILSDTRGAIVGYIFYGIYSNEYIKNKIYKNSNIIILLLIMTILYITSIADMNYLNKLSSNRILIWLDILNERRISTDSIDSSFLYFGANNIIGLYLIVVWVIYSFTFINKYFSKNIKYYILIMVLGVFDVGLLSCTNLIALHCWTLLLLGKPKYSIKY